MSKDMGAVFVLNDNVSSYSFVWDKQHKTQARSLLFK